MASKSKFSNMTYRIAGREDNIYHPKMISSILNMYLDECRKALMKGENVQLKGIGTLMPEIKTHRRYYSFHTCENVDEYLPYTRLRMHRSRTLINDMDKTLLKNIQDGILGLEELPFDKQQITNLKNCGLVPNEENEHDGYEEG